MKKRILSLALALLMALALLPFGALAAESLHPYAAVLEPLDPDACGAYCDLDGDGTHELILFVQEGEDCFADVYTIRSGKAERIFRELFRLETKRLSLHRGENGETYLQLIEEDYVPTLAQDGYDYNLYRSAKRNRLFTVDGLEISPRAEATADVLQTKPGKDGTSTYYEEESRYWIDGETVSASDYYSRLYMFRIRNEAFLTIASDDPVDGERAERLLAVARRGYVYVPEPNGVECYAVLLQEILDQSRNPVYGTFVDLDRNGTVELIIQRECGIQSHFFDIYTPKNGVPEHLFREQYVYEPDEYTMLTQAPDGSLALVMHREGGEAGFETDDGVYYFYSHIRDDVYQLRDGSVVRTDAALAERLQTPFDEDGSYSYFPDESQCTVNGAVVSEDDYWAWLDRYYEQHPAVLMLAPDIQTDGSYPVEQLLAAAKGGFIDVPPTQYYAAPVNWAVEEHITNGTGWLTFSPDSPCTRGQVVTFLWRAAGSPEPQSTTNPFTDVKPGDYFYQAVLWAVEQGITNGMNPTQFAPNAACTRAHVVTFLWRWHEKPAAGELNPFTDVPAGTYYTEAVLWAVSKNITNGVDETHFGPDSICRRGQIVTFLYRDLAK